MHTRSWHLQIDIFEDDGRTRAETILRTDVGTELRHAGTARRRPGDAEVPEIGDELAVCRALNGLVHDLFDATLADLDANDPDGTATVRLD
ncbi:MAG TPA: DUF1876 domain-containing protein [Nocardioides sp.]|uniref:DUF1876 domain-containing protein n=1 Tax=Nocardioides sp. TaxID=35761 RepID=UPI002B7198EB|nr:DUF1876 domain-containing protein [Nocardioides sp.]HTW13889.1 DUF1876 domain-containing protein [Nocardioides sp.]